MTVITTNNNIDITKIEIPYQRGKILEAYKKYDYDRDETTEEMNYYRNFLPLVKAKPVTWEVQAIYRLKHKGKEWIKYFVRYTGHDWKVTN